MKHLISIITISILFITCKKEENEQIRIDDDIINSYLTTNQINAIKHEAGLYYIITTEGDGDSPDINSIIEVKYKGYLTNGNVFDETSGDNTFTYPISGLIEGWKIGIPLLKKGGKGTFFIPSYLGYGNRNLENIPTNSVLIFEIELINFD